MALTNEDKARVLRQKITNAQEQQYGFLIDHELYTMLGNTDRIAKAEADLKACVMVIQHLAKRLNELSDPKPEPEPEHVNGREPAHADAAE